MDMKQGIQHTFDMVAQGYDHPALAFFPETAKRMMSYLAPEASGQMLDVCTGRALLP